MRKPIIAGNWKMNKTIDESIELANGIKRELFEIENVEIVLCPPYTSLSDCYDVVTNSNIELGGQDVYWLEEGAYTGEVSPRMLKAAGCNYVIIGHSERRQCFNETNESVNKKVKAVLKEGLSPIMCVGERLEERERHETFDVIRDHVEGGLKGLSKEEVLKVVIAYEPVWAIGTGKVATPREAEEAHRFIRDLLKKLYDKTASESLRIQYGGSVKPDNIESLMKEEDIDGALVGGASLEAGQFVDIIKRSSKVIENKQGL